MEITPNPLQAMTQLSFATSCLAMGAAAFFFYNEKDRVHPRYRISLLLATMICGIACFMYFYMKEKYLPGQSFPTQDRYFDWLVTTPLLLVEFTALLKFKEKTGAISRLVFWDLLMIVAGYMGETMGFAVGGFQLRWVMFVVSCGGWLGVLIYLYTGIRQQANLADPNTRQCIVVLTRFITFGWLIYPIGYVVRALAPDLTDACQLIYNVADVVNKVGFGIVVWATGVYALETSTRAKTTDENKDPLPVS